LQLRAYLLIGCVVELRVLLFVWKVLGGEQWAARAAIEAARFWGQKKGGGLR
jgi:hypothetical protein